jgi:transposase
LLTVKKFFCRTPDCPRKIFVERLDDFLAVSSRLTMRLRSSVQEIGFATCGKGSERLSHKLGLPVSEVRLLRSLYLLPLPPIGKVQVIGIDDGSYRRGKRYGTIIVDLRTHKIIDLLPERSVESVVTWLASHHSVTPFVRQKSLFLVVKVIWLYTGSQ